MASETDIYARGFMTAKELERFFDKVATEANTGCWLWMGIIRKGYGRVTQAQKHFSAHKVMYLHMGGVIPEGQELDHLCDTPSCVNPDHLRPVTHPENVRRGKGAAGDHFRRTHCKKGHPLSGDNLLRDRRGRHCRECERRRALAHYYQHHDKILQRQRLRYSESRAR